MKTRIRNSRGFTVVELMIATSLFSLVLLVFSATFTKIGQLFYKGIIASKTQESARSLIDELSRSVQFSSGAISSSSTMVCIGGTHYNYSLNTKVEPSVYAVKKRLTSSGDACTAVSGSEILSENMRLLDFRVVPQASADLYDIYVTVAYGDNDLFTENPTTPNSRCKGGAGGQFCAVSALKTTVLRRVD